MAYTLRKVLQVSGTSHRPVLWWAQSSEPDASTTKQKLNLEEKLQ